MILSSFPPESISNKPHHSIKTIENTHAASTKIEMANKTKSQKAIVSQKILPELAAYVVSIIGK